jgi:dihydroorotase
VDCCAGIFTEPVALPLLADLFEKEGALDQLEWFVSMYGPKFYGLPVCREPLTLVKESWRVSKELHGVVPFWAGKSLTWKVKGAPWMEGE